MRRGRRNPDLQARWRLPTSLSTGSAQTACGCRTGLATSMPTCISDRLCRRARCGRLVGWHHAHARSTWFTRVSLSGKAQCATGRPSQKPVRCPTPWVELDMDMDFDSQDVQPLRLAGSVDAHGSFALAARPSSGRRRRWSSRWTRGMDAQPRRHHTGCRHPPLHSLEGVEAAVDIDAELVAPPARHPGRYPPFSAARIAAPGGSQLEGIARGRAHLGGQPAVPGRVRSLWMGRVCWVSTWPGRSGQLPRPR